MSAQTQNYINHYGIEVANTLQWDHWEPGGEYTKQIILKNVNLKTKKLQYRIPNRRFFTTRYPQPIVLCSGASVKLPIIFRPIENSFHEDVIEFFTKEGEFHIPMKAVLPEAQLRMPNAMKFGMCAVKDLVKISFHITNTSDIHTVFQMFCVEPFTLNPSSGTLAPLTQCEVTAQFKPEEAHVYNVDAVCMFGKDVNEKKTIKFNLEGIGKYPHLGIRYEEQTGTDINVMFGDVYVRQQVEKVIDLINYTPVDAPFQILQKSRGISVDNVFSCSHYHGIIPAEGTFKIKIVFNPENIQTEYVDNFEILAVGLTSHSSLKCIGCGIGPDVHLEVPSINFSCVSLGEVVTKSFKLKNLSNFPAIFQFQIDERNSVFKLDTSSGTINGNSTKTVNIQFQPLKPIVYFRRIFFIVHNQGALTLDVFGTCCTPTVKPAILSKEHLQSYLSHVQSGISRLSPDQILDYIKQNAIVVSDKGSLQVIDQQLEKILEKSSLPLCNWHEYFNQLLFQGMETLSPHVSVDTHHMDFGMCKEHFNFQKAISVSNHTRGRVHCSWMNFDKNSFTVSPSEADIEPMSCISFMINFRSKGPGRFYCTELEAYVFYKSMRDHRLVDERTITRPWCLTVTVSAHTFSRHSEKFNPVCKWEKSKLIFPPVTSTCGSVYRTCVLQNHGENPVFYSFDEDDEHVFQCKPVIGLLNSTYQIVAFQMSPTSEENCQKKITCNMNADPKYDQNFECIATIEKPQVSILPNDLVYFKPTCVGDFSKQFITVKNTTRVKLQLLWKIAKTDANELKVSSLSCLILPNEIQKHEFSFVPSSPLKYLFKVKLLVSGEQERSKKYQLRFIGEGKIGLVTCEEEHVQFNDILVGVTSVKGVTLRNDGHCNVSFEILVEQQNNDQNDIGKEKVLTTECKCYVVPARSSMQLQLYATPVSSLAYAYSVSYRLKSKIEVDENTVTAKAGHLFNVTIQGVYPSLVVTDIHGGGCVERFSKSFLRQLFRLDNLNLLLKADPESRELKYSIASRHSTRKRMPTTTGAVNLFDFGSSVIGSGSSVISLNFQNLGTCPVQWVLKFPTELQLDMEFWAESGDIDDDEMHEMYVMTNELFSIEPKSGCIDAAENQTITFTYRHTLLGVHQLPLLFKIVQGREIRLNLLGHTIETSSRRLLFTSFHHTFAPVAIGESSSIVQSYTLYNASDKVVRFSFDVSPLDKLTQDNYDWPVLRCLTQTDEIQPNDTAVTYWVFSPLEARAYEVDIPLSVHEGDTSIIRFTGTGFHPSHKKFYMLTFIKEEVRKPTIACETQCVRLSTDKIQFDDVPLFTEERRIIFLTNSSPDHTMSFSWNFRGTPAEGVLSITPQNGLLEPNQRILCKVQVFSYAPVAFHNFDIICKILDETEMKNYEKKLRKKESKEEEKRGLFTITDKVREKSTPNSKRKHRKNASIHSGGCSLPRYETLPPIHSKQKKIKNETSGSLLNESESQIGEDLIKPRHCALHLEVTIKTDDAGNWLKRHAPTKDKIFIQRRPVGNTSCDFTNQLFTKTEELNSIQFILQCMMKDLLLDNEFLTSLELFEDEPVPYFQMFSREIQNLSNEEPIQQIEEDLHHKVLKDRQFLKRSDEMRQLLENCLENTILNILSEDIPLTQRTRLITKLHQKQIEDE